MADPICILNGISRRVETNSTDFARTLARIEAVAALAHPILLTGELGVGKNYLARLIHEISPRRYEPFLKVACGSLPHDSTDSTLFGSANNGQASEAKGAMSAVRRGTLVLNDVGTLRLEPQERLARLVAAAPDQVNGLPLTKRWPARLIGISDVDLEQLMQEGRFGTDFYQVLQPFRFEIPPLRRRSEDIGILATKFIRQLSVKLGASIHSVDPGVFKALVQYPWPGNVLELRSVMERTILRCKDVRLKVSHLPMHIVSGEIGGGTTHQSGDSPLSIGTEATAASSPEIAADLLFNEKEIIEQTLFQDTFSRGASQRGISPVTLYSKMKKYDPRS